jgi:hypothetical protein
LVVTPTAAYKVLLTQSLRPHERRRTPAQSMT